MPMRRRLFALLLFAAVSGSVTGTVSADQRTTSSARIPALPPLTEVANTCPLPRQYRPAFEAAARKTDLPLPLALLVAVGQIESNLRSDTGSRADAPGVMQVLPSTAQCLGLDADEPASNVFAGARYPRLFDRLHSSDLALAAYNAGPTAVEEAGGAPTAETLSYVANVTSTWRELRGCR